MEDCKKWYGHLVSGASTQNCTRTLLGNIATYNNGKRNPHWIENQSSIETMPAAGSGGGSPSH
jgi:aryl-phospho-beta-D-glucosidase BglC (GH1 family)